MQKILEIHSLSEAIPHLKKNTHLFLDLDNTVMTSISEFGSERWERYMIDHFVQQGIEKSVAVERASQLWKAVQTVSDIRFVEDFTREFLKTWNNPVFAITARDFSFRAVTEKQLDHLGLKFSECNTPFSLEDPDYSKGVFYCGYVPKGKVLKWYQDHHPECHIVFVDDYRSHLETAADYLHSFVGLRYGFLDDRKANYSPCEVTKLMSKVFNHPQASLHLRKGIHSDS